MAKKAFVYDGTQWVDIAQSTADLSTYQKSNRTGLQLVVPTSVTGGTVSANGAITIGSGVSSVTVSGAFSATYDTYKIIITGGSGNTAGTQLGLTFGSTATGYYSSIMYSAYGSATASASTDSNGVRFTYAGYSTGATNTMNLEVSNPFLAENTVIWGNSPALLTAGYGGAYSGFLNNTTSYTDFTIAPLSGTITGGTIRIYGYNNGV